MFKVCKGLLFQGELSYIYGKHIRLLQFKQLIIIQTKINFLYESSLSRLSIHFPSALSARTFLSKWCKYLKYFL